MQWTSLFSCLTTETMDYASSMSNIRAEEFYMKYVGRCNQKQLFY